MRAASLLALFAVPVLGALLAAPAGAAESRLHDVVRRAALRVCVWTGYEGISWRDPRSGAIRGLDADMARELGAELRVPVVFVETTLTAFPAALAQDQCDVAMTGIAMNGERQALVRFTRPYLRHDVVAVTARGSKRVRTWVDVDRPDVVVGVLAGTAAEEAARRHLRRASLVVIGASASRERDLEAGRIDAYVTSYPPAAQAAQRNDWIRLLEPDRPIHVFEYAYAVKPGDDPWAERMDRFVVAIREDNRLRQAAERHGLGAMLIGAKP